MSATDTFILANTRLLAPPLVPEIKLHLAEESLPIWQKTEEELGAMNVPPPYWAFAWAGGQALARYIHDNPELVRGSRVLDLGSGSGLTAIAAKLAGATSVLAADIDTMALAAVTLNAQANAVEIDVTPEDLLSGDPGACGYGTLARAAGASPVDAGEGADPRTSVILVGDLFYERQLADKVLTFINKAAATGAVVLIGDPQRSYFPRGRFTCVAEYQVPVTRELEDAEIKHTAVWRA